MQKYNRNSRELSKLSAEVKHLLDYHFYALWYDDCWDFREYERDCDKYYGYEGMDWYCENREMMKRNETINEVLGITGDIDDLPFKALNF
tara:strand:+ start:578 stop:847 length:270 start_codon:yes stop_codon:yes gene_type:complete